MSSASPGNSEGSSTPSSPNRPLSGPSNATAFSQGETEFSTMALLAPFSPSGSRPVDNANPRKMPTKPTAATATVLLPPPPAPSQKENRHVDDQLKNPSRQPREDDSNVIAHQPTQVEVSDAQDTAATQVERKASHNQASSIDNGIDLNDTNQEVPPSKKQDVPPAKSNMCIAEPESTDEVAPPMKTPVKVVVLPAPKKVPTKATSSAAKPNSQPTKSRKRPAPEMKAGQTTGRWTHEEHQAFLEGLKIHGREWKKFAMRIPTRTSAQIRSHAQKYFAKMSREETLLRHEHHQPQPPPLVMPSPASAHPRIYSNSPVVPPPPPQNTNVEESPSLQHNVHRILADPQAVQWEVEDTLAQLRERYRQLQIRLERSHQRRRRRGEGQMDRIVEDDQVPQHVLARPRDRRKRTLDEASFGSDQAQHDDASSVSSNLSASLASFSPTREFGNEELIALHVLGGALPRSASNQDLHPMDETESNEPPNERSSPARDHQNDQM